MLSREFHELIYVESVADDLLIAYDVGRALAAVEQRHFAEAQARADRRNPLLAAILSLHPDLHADCAARHYEEQLGFRSFADDDLPLLEDQGPDDGFDQPIVLGAQPFEQVELGERKFRPGSLRRTCQQLVLAPFERGVGVAEDAHRAPLLLSTKLAGERAKRTVVGDRREDKLRPAIGN